MIVDGLPLPCTVPSVSESIFFLNPLKLLSLTVMSSLELYFFCSCCFLAAVRLFRLRKRCEIFRHFLQLQITTQPFPKGFPVTVPEFPGVYPVVLTSFYRISLKHLPNLFNACWLLKISLAGDFNQWEMEKY